MASLGEPWRPWERSGILERDVERSALSSEGRHCCQRSHGVVRRDMTLPGWTWRGRDGHVVSG